MRIECSSRAKAAGGDSYFYLHVLSAALPHRILSIGKELRGRPDRGNLFFSIDSDSRAVFGTLVSFYVSIREGRKSLVVKSWTGRAFPVTDEPKLRLGRFPGILRHGPNFCFQAPGMK